MLYEVITATTLAEYRKHIEKDAALERRFQPVLCPEPSVEDTIAILRGLKERYEVHHGVRIMDEALIAAATLSVITSYSIHYTKLYEVAFSYSAVSALFMLVSAKMPTAPMTTPMTAIEMNPNHSLARIPMFM